MLGLGGDLKFSPTWGDLGVSFGLQFQGDLGFSASWVDLGILLSLGFSLG